MPELLESPDESAPEPPKKERKKREPKEPAGATPEPEIIQDSNWTGLCSETTHGRPYLAKYCRGLGLDIGFGGDSITPNAITMDQWQPYTQVGGQKQVLRGTAGDLSGFCDESLDFIHSSHLLEDFPYEVLVNILTEWRRVLKVGGFVVTNCPDQRRFLAHCAATGQGINEAHYEPDFSIETFEQRVLERTGPWETIFREPDARPYSWYLVVKKV